MIFKALFRSTRDLTPDQLRAYLASHRADAFTLLDVRQPGEYERGHLPGAVLIPLPRLSSRLGELDPGKPVITYCAAGVRSRAAAEMVAGAGFKEVYSLRGGLHAWKGLTAAGPPSQGLGVISGGEGLGEMLAVAYGMELGLRRFYEEARERAESAASAELLASLAQVEAKHQERVWGMYALAAPAGADRQALEDQATARVMEGGQELEHALAELAPQNLRPAALLELAMALETQALDLYLRLARKVREESARRALVDLGQDEKAHLEALARRLEGLTNS